MQQPPYPNQPPQYPYQQPYPPQYPYQPPPVPPRQPGHGAVYWTLFILFFPVTVPYVILKALLVGRKQPANVHPAHQHHHPSAEAQLRRFNRTLRMMQPKNRTRKW